MPKGKILVVDDSRLSRRFCTDILVEDGFTVETASTGLEALELIKAGDFDLVVLDLVLPDIGGQDVLKRTKQIKASTGFIIITGYASLDSAIDCLKSGALDYLTKPLNAEEFKIIVNRTIEQRRLFEENTGLRRLVRLYEISRLISSCLSYERFYEVLLDSFLQVVEGKIGLAIFSDKRQPLALTLKAYRGTNDDNVSTLTDKVISYIKETERAEILNIDSRDLDIRSSGIGPLLLTPIKRGEEIEGHIAVFNPPGTIYNSMDTENAAFIASQASVALENIQLYHQVKELTYIDDVTKLHNVRYLDVVLESEIKRARRFNSHLSLLFIDIDYFKRINDIHGHRMGSKVLFEVGQLLKEIVREVDTVIRYGGDEFTVLLVETGSDGALIIAERIRTAVEEHTFLSGEGLSIRFTITIGVATYPQPAKNKEELLTLADSAMYKGKRTSRNVVVLA